MLKMKLLDWLSILILIRRINLIKVKYLYQSGFTIETDQHFLVIDYYKGDLNLPDKNTTFFVTHHHEDHFNREIFKFKDRASYVISDDVAGVYEMDNLIFVHEGDSLSFNGMDLKVFGSTDEGSSFLIGVDGLNIFHSGDLNWWAWEDMGPAREEERRLEYTSEINKLKDLNLDIDLAFVPVDPRLDHNYYLAGKYFIENIRPSYFFPMHFGDNYSCNEKFIHKMQESNTHIFNVDKLNQEFIINI